MSMLFIRYKFISLILIFLLIPSLLISQTQVPQGFFTDVPKSHWAYDAIKELFERGIIEGFEGRYETKFQGDKPLTRYEFAQALYKAILKLEAEFSATKPTGKIDEIDVNQVLKKSSLDKHDIELLQKLVEEFKKELADISLRTAELEARQRNSEIKKSDKTPFYISIGSAIISLIALIVAISK